MAKNCMGTPHPDTHAKVYCSHAHKKENQTNAERDLPHTMKYYKAYE